MTDNLNYVLRYGAWDGSLPAKKRSDVEYFLRKFQESFPMEGGRARGTSAEYSEGYEQGADDIIDALIEHLNSLNYKIEPNL